MSDEPGGSALRAVPGGPVVEEDAAEDAVDGLTPPERILSRSIPAVIAEMGFASRERVDDAMAKAKASGRPPEQELLDSGAVRVFDSLAELRANLADTPFK